VGHPAIVLSSDDVMADSKQARFNVVLGTRKQPAEQARTHHAFRFARRRPVSFEPFPETAPLTQAVGPAARQQ
jgi:hypothetical protein